MTSIYVIIYISISIYQFINLSLFYQLKIGDSIESTRARLRKRFGRIEEK